MDGPAPCFAKMAHQEGVVRITEWYRTSTMFHVQYTGQVHHVSIRSWADGWTILDFMDGSAIGMNRVM